jgi:hypothetical protein
VYLGFFDKFNLLQSSHTDGYIFFLHIVNTFCVTHFTNEDLLNIKRKEDTKSRTLSRTSDTTGTESRNPCVIKDILLACSTYIGFIAIKKYIENKNKEKSINYKFCTIYITNKYQSKILTSAKHTH